MKIEIRTAVLAAAVTLIPVGAPAQEASPAAPPAQVAAPAAAPAPVAAPAATPAQVATPTATPGHREDAPNWTIGAGVGNLFVFSSSPPTSPLAATSISIPNATFFLERRVGTRTWLVFTAAGSVSRTRLDAPQPGISFSLPTDADSELISGTVGLRRVVTRPGTVVDLSVYAAVGGGYFHSEQKYENGAGVVTTSTDRTGFASLEGGIAVERELIGGLAVRLSTPLVGADWSSRREGTDQTTGIGGQEGWTFSAAVMVSPRVELRLAF